MFTTIVVLAVLGVAAEAAIAVLSLTGGSEYLEFAIAMVLFVLILVGSYLFVIMPTPQGRRDEGGTEE
jgi:hypothetical protein